MKGARAGTPSAANFLLVAATTAVAARAGQRIGHPAVRWRVGPSRECDDVSISPARAALVVEVGGRFVALSGDRHAIPPACGPGV